MESEEKIKSLVAAQHKLEQSLVSHIMVDALTRVSFL